MDSIPCLNILEHARISAPSGTIGHRSLSLTFFDITWLLFPPVHHLFFYDFPHSKSHFMDTIVPRLKQSLSVTLQHFFPFASNLIVFPNTDGSGFNKKPEIKHVEGDSVVVTFAECCLDFNNLTGNHPRKCENFYPLVPSLGNAIKLCDCVTVPLFSLQVTFFPGSGISLGMTNHHSLGDASTRFNFLKGWTSIIQSGVDRSFLTKGSPPVFDRLINIPHLDENKLRHTRLESFYKPSSLVGPTDKVRSTFVLTRTNINLLKKKVLTQVPNLEYMSSFTVTCGYIWSCIAKSLVKIGERKGEDELEQFIITIDCRSRLDPPIPTAYFGNCGAPCVPTLKNVVLTSENGYALGAKVIGESICKMIYNKDGILKDAARWHEPFMIPARKIGVAGTPKLNLYDFDFGWGKPIKYETVSIDYNTSISINASKTSAQDLEIGLSLPSMQMEAFSSIFDEGLESQVSL
uniref:Malonyl-coenzyme A: anthocyanidin 3-O-glucoside-6''-O-malonyltransferase n=1 Tax=Pericallis cruenta TaxID=98709 RepID=Q84LA6_PERCU|nr:malonyl-coenzyme A: anthocyanidin 3-O-glucoside-6''-O-malonyltransferase [Pericallis cruenta]